MSKRQITRNDLFFRELNFQRESINQDSRSVDVSFSSETDTVVRWGEPEILNHAAGAVNLTRLNSMGVVLFNHDRDQVLGKVLNARIENSRGMATLVFDDDDESERIFQKVLSGTLRGISVSYTYDEYSFLGTNEVSADGRFKGPCLLVSRWTPTEISVVSVPADATVGIGRALGDEIRPMVEAIVKETMERMAADSHPGPPVVGGGERELEVYIDWLESVEMTA